MKTKRAAVADCTSANVKALINSSAKQIGPRNSSFALAPLAWEMKPCGELKFRFLKNVSDDHYLHRPLNIDFLNLHFILKQVFLSLLWFIDEFAK